MAAPIYKSYKSFEVSMAALTSLLFIRNQEKHKKLPYYTWLMYHLKFKHDIEKSIFIHNCEISKFEKLWSLWDNIFDFWWSEICFC